MINNYCAYCHNAISSEEAYTVDIDGNIYHPICYVQLNTYTDEFGNYNTIVSNCDDNE